MDMGSHVATVQQHRSVLAQHLFPLEEREGDEFGPGRSGNLCITLTILCIDPE
jgi:hypothetical protein